MLADAKRRAQFIKKLFNAKGRLFLDIGCGSEGAVHTLNKMHKDRFVGIDVHEVWLRHTRNKGLKVFLADARHLPFKKGVFDGIICSEVLEHIKEDKEAIREIARVLKKGCIAVISVPNREFEEIFPFKKLVRNIYLRQKNGHVRKGYSASELKALFEKESLKLQRIEYDLKAIGAFFHLILYFLYSYYQDTKFKRFLLRTYKRLLNILVFLYSLDNILTRKGYQIFASFTKI